MKKSISFIIKQSLVILMIYLCLPSFPDFSFSLNDVKQGAQNFHEWIIDDENSVKEKITQIYEWVEERTPKFSLSEIKQDVHAFLFLDESTTPDVLMYRVEDLHKGITDNEESFINNEYVNQSPADVEPREEFDWGEPINVSDWTLPGVIRRSYKLVADNVDVTLGDHFDFDKEISVFDLSSTGIISNIKDTFSRLAKEEEEE